MGDIEFEFIYKKEENLRQDHSTAASDHHRVIPISSWKSTALDFARDASHSFFGKLKFIFALLLWL